MQSRYKTPKDIPVTSVYVPDSLETYDEPKQMYVWRDSEPEKLYIKPVTVVQSDGTALSKVPNQPYFCEVWDHCAQVPANPMDKTRVTNRVLSRWVSHGFGEVTDTSKVGHTVSTVFEYPVGSDDKPVSEHVKVRSFMDTEFVDPTLRYIRNTSPSYISEGGMDTRQSDWWKDEMLDTVKRFNDSI